MRQGIRDKVFTTFDSRLGSRLEFNVGKFTKFLWDFECKLPIAKMNEIFNIIIAQKARKDKVNKNSSKNELITAAINTKSKTIDTIAASNSKSFIAPSTNTVSTETDNYSRGLDFEMFKAALK